MTWYDEAVFYHIYPLGLTGAPKQNDYSEPVHRLNTLLPWIDHLKKLGFTALYIGPLFESAGHGYETTDYKKLDSRLGTNEDLKAFVKACHDNGLRVIFDGVFNHTGRDFFAFKDIQENRENSRYRDWYCNVNFQGNTEYNDGFSYDNWGGFNLLVKLNQRNPEVKDYIADVIRFWVSEFDVDGIRLDAADVLDFDFMKMLRWVADSVKPEFWLMGEVIHGDYSRWANESTLHSVTNYAVHKALYSSHNDHNYFELAHTIRYTGNMITSATRLYNFVDNHDVERIYTKLANKAHYFPVHVLLYTLPGIPSVYYGSEFGIEGKKERWSDDSLRPYINLEDHKNDYTDNPCTVLIAALGAIHRDYQEELSYGCYQELTLTNRQFAYTRGSLIIAVNNDDHSAAFSVNTPDGTYRGLLSNTTVSASNGTLEIILDACSGEIFAPIRAGKTVTRKEPKEQCSAKPVTSDAFVSKTNETAIRKPDSDFQKTRPSRTNIKPEKSKESKPEASVEIPDIPYSEMTVEQLQAVILAKMAKNGPITDQMRKDVENNIWHDSLVNWANSFH